LCFCVPGDYRKLLGEWPDGARLVKEAKAPLDLVHLFATEAKGLARACADIARRSHPTA
jgi:hypothetical protein